MMCKEPTKYSWVLAILYRLSEAREADPDSLEVQLFLDSHLAIVNYICCLPDHLSNEELESSSDWRFFTRDTKAPAGVCFGDLPDCRNFVDFFFYGDVVKAKTEEQFSTVAHCLICKTMNRKCQNRTLLNILVKKFALYPFLRSMVRMILCVGLLGNYDYEGIHRTNYTQRYLIYQLMDYRDCGGDGKFDEWVLTNVRLCEILLREFMTECVKSTYVFERLMYDICDPGNANQWEHSKKSTKKQCNMIRSMFNISCDNPTQLLEEIDEKLRVIHEEDLCWTIPKVFDSENPLYTQIPVATAEVLSEEELHVMTLLDQREQRPPCDQNLRRLCAHHGESCYTNLVTIRYHLYQYRGTKIQAHCVDCASRLKQYLEHREKWVNEADIFLGSDILHANIMVYRRKNDIPEWEQPPISRFTSLYCSSEFPHWLSASVGNMKDTVPMHICGVNKAFFDPWTNEIHCAKDSTHSKTEVRSKLLYGRVVTMGGKRWTLCIHCGVIIPFDTYVLTTDGPACVRHAKLRNPQMHRYVSPRANTTEKVYLELYPPSHVPLEDVFVQPEPKKVPVALPMIIEPEEEEELPLLLEEEKPEVEQIFLDMIKQEEEANNPTVSTPSVKPTKVHSGGISCMNCGKDQKPKARKPFSKIHAKDNNNTLITATLCHVCKRRIQKFLDRRNGQIIDIEELKRKLATQSLFRGGNRQKIPEKYMK